MLPIEAIEQLTALIDQRKQIGLDDTPDQLVVDVDVLVGELVAKADDLRCLFDLSEQRLITLRQLRQRFTDGDEFTLDRGADQTTVAVLVEADASNSLVGWLARPRSHR